MSVTTHRRHAHHEVSAAGRLFRLRIWLSSAMWVFVLAANVIAVVLAICLPLLDQHLGDRDSLPIAAGAVQAIFGALAGGMITFTGIVFWRSSSRRRSRRRPTPPGSPPGCGAIRS